MFHFVPDARSVLETLSGGLYIAKQMSASCSNVTYRNSTKIDLLICKFRVHRNCAMNFFFFSTTTLDIFYYVSILNADLKNKNLKAEHEARKTTTRAMQKKKDGRGTESVGNPRVGALSRAEITGTYIMQCFFYGSTTNC